MQNFIILLLFLLYYRLIYYFIIYKYICVRLYFEFLQKYFGFAGGGERGERGDVPCPSSLSTLGQGLARSSGEKESQVRRTHGS